jgi:hypothetical protein
MKIMTNRSAPLNLAILILCKDDGGNIRRQGGGAGVVATGT